MPSLPLSLESLLKIPDKTCFHFIGIGGIGMSALAQFLYTQGFNVQGSDTKAANFSSSLKGIRLYTNHASHHIANATHIVISSAIDEQNPEIKEAKTRNLPLIKRGDFLGEITKSYQTIGVTGAHGKTTTTALIGNLLKKGNLNPTIFCGGIMRDTQTNFLSGKSPWLITELDESDGSHQKATMHMGIITNIDCEHMNFYRTLDQLKKSFENFLNNIAPDGLGVVCMDNTLVREVMLKNASPLMTYGFSPRAKIHLQNYRVGDQGSIFDVVLPDGTSYKDLHLSLYGQHNVQNAGAALAASYHLGIDENIVRHTFKNFKGIQRRFNDLGTIKGVRFFDDYAHHPVEIKAMLKTAKTLCKNRLVAVCEIHRYSRLRDLFEPFTTCFDDADIVSFLPLYSAGETPLPLISTKHLARTLQKKGKKVLVFNSFDEAAQELISVLNQDDCVVCMGAGQSTLFAQKLPQIFSEKGLPQASQSIP